MARADLARGISEIGALSGDGGGRSFRRILVRVDATGLSSSALTVATGLSVADAGIADQVMRRATCPVLAVRPGQQ